MRTLGELSQVTLPEEPVPSPLPLRAGLAAIPAGYTPSLPLDLLLQMYRTLQSFAQSLDRYATDNPEYRANVTTWRTQASLILNRAITGRWPRDTIARQFEAHIQRAREILATPQAWTAYIGTALQERAAGLVNAIRTAVATAAETAAAAAEYAAEKAGGVLTAFAKGALLPILMLGGFGLLALLAWRRSGE